MSNLKKAIKKYSKSHTVRYEIGGVLINLFGYGNRRMTVENVRYKAYTRLNKKYKKFIGKNLKKYSDTDMSNTIWICWLQGMDNAPELVKNCYKSIKYHIKDRKIIVVDKNNLNDYIDLPNYIVDKWEKGIISNTHFSDIIRLNILNRHGGLWLDATTYFTGELPDYITDSDFFVYQNDWFNNELINMGSWLIYTKPNNIFLLETENLIFEYWKTHNYLQQYFLLHIFFKMVTDKYSLEWKNVQYYNQIDQHILMNEWNRKFDAKRFEQIKQITPIHKLTTKIDDIQFEENSYYSMLSELYKF